MGELQNEGCDMFLIEIHVLLGMMLRTRSSKIQKSRLYQ